MAPSVLRLEIGRLSGLIDRLPLTDARRNQLVTARYRLGLLRALVTENFHAADLNLCDEHLRLAILALGLRPGHAVGVSVAGTTAAKHATLDTTLDNIADRLGYVRERLRRLH